MQPIDIHTYYDKTNFDYRIIWNGGRNQAVHFGYYDEQADKHHLALDNLNRVLADCAGVQPGERVLDAGCGLGNACFWLAAQRGAEVTGISVVQSQVDACRRALAQRPVPGVRFETADYTATAFPDASFDVVWACESVCHAADKGAFYREAWRLLRPGGRLVMAEYLRVARPASARGEALLEAWLRPWAIPDIDTADEHFRQALAAGFSALEVTDITANMRVSLRNLHHLCKKWLPYGKILRALRLVHAVRLNNLKASIRQYEALEEGVWRYGLLLAKKAG